MKDKEVTSKQKALIILLKQGLPLMFQKCYNYKHADGIIMVKSLIGLTEAGV